MTETKLPAPQLRAQQRFQALLGQGLSRHYAQVAAEPVPEEFLHLLERAERTTALKEPKD